MRILILTVIALLCSSPVLAQPSFSVLGASTVTNTGPSLITGDVGVSPGTAITGFPPGVATGDIYAGGLVPATAHAAAVVAYATLKAADCDMDLTGQELGQTVLELGPGTYCFSSSVGLTGTLYLTGDGPWVFQIGSTLTTASASRVILTNPEAACEVSWQVGSSATLGTTTEFVGNIYALASVTMTTGANVNGSVSALTGAVTLDSNRVGSEDCGVAPPEPPDEDDCDCDCDHDHHDKIDHDRKHRKHKHKSDHRKDRKDDRKKRKHSGSH